MRTRQGVGPGTGSCADNGEYQMKIETFNTGDAAPLGNKTDDLVIAGYMADAAAGEVAALFNLGVAYSTGSNDVAADLVEAHKWFNLAASRGHEEAGWCRADVSDEMTAREIAEAQRRARRWLSEERRAA